MITPRQDLIVQAGETVSRTVATLRTGGALRDLSGWTAAGAIREQIDSALVMSLDSAGGTLVLGGAAGTVTIVLSSALTASLRDQFLPIERLIQVEHGIDGLTWPATSKDRMVSSHENASDRWVYDIDVISAGGERIRAAQGRFILVPSFSLPSWL